MNYFSPKTAAERFAQGRPFFHPFVIQKIIKCLPRNSKFPLALDVGCGTGFSAVALKEIADRVVGLDASAEMISLAPADEKIFYLLSSAEVTPFPEHVFDLISMSQILHWLDRKSFFEEARRILKPAGWIVVYDNYFSAQMPDNTKFQNWHRRVFLQKYPAPPRNWVSFADEIVEREGFRLMKHDSFSNTIRFSRKSLTRFLMTLTNVIAAVEGGKEKLEDVGTWLGRALEPFFQNFPEEEFSFKAPVWILRRTD